MSKNYALAIIDMQSYFTAANNKELKKPILREIELAKRNNRPIIVIEFKHYLISGKLALTKGYITSALRGYKNKIRLYKSTNDGSREISDYLENKYSKLNSVRVVGVKSDYCVLETVCGLYDKGYIVTTVADCIYSDGDHQQGIDKILNISKDKPFRYNISKIIRLKGK